MAHLPIAHPSARAGALRRRKARQSVIYVLSLGEALTKIGMTTDWPRRRASLTHHGSLTVVGEACFHVDADEVLRDVEAVALNDARGVYRQAGGREWFVAPFDEVVTRVARVLGRWGCEYELHYPNASDAEVGVGLSEMTADQLDIAIQRFGRDHGVSPAKVIRWLDADRHGPTMRKTGLVPNEVAADIEALWNRPALLFEPRK